MSAKLQVRLIDQFPGTARRSFRAEELVSAGRTLRAGAALARNKNKKKFLESAGNPNDIELLNFLIQYQADLKKQDKHGNRLWSYAIESEFNDIPRRNGPLFYLSVVKFRQNASKIAEAVSVELKDKEGMTALHLAVKNRNPEKVKAILALKPDLNAITANGDTVLSLSVADPWLYMFLYGAGARAPGKIDDCDKAKSLLKAIVAQGYFENSPEETARSSAPEDCLTASANGEPGSAKGEESKGSGG